MMMGWLKTRSSDLFATLQILDAVAPQWRFANDDHHMRRAGLIGRHADNLSQGRDTPDELWVCISDPTDAANLRATLDFEEWGYAVWDEERQVRNGYHYSGNSSTAVPGWVISR